MALSINMMIYTNYSELLFEIRKQSQSKTVCYFAFLYPKSRPLLNSSLEQLSPFFLDDSC